MWWSCFSITILLYESAFYCQIFFNKIYISWKSHRRTDISKRKRTAFWTVLSYKVGNSDFLSIFLTNIAILRIFELRFSASCFLLQDSGSLRLLFWLIASIFCFLASIFCFQASFCIDYQIFCRLLSLLCFLICKVFQFLLFHQWTRTFKAVQSILCSHQRWW